MDTLPSSNLAERKTKGGCSNLKDVVPLASWPTPTETELGNTLESYRAMKANMKSGPRTAITELGVAAQLASWPTPNTPSGGPNSKRQERGAGGADLDEVASWATPAARDWRDGRASEETMERSRPLNEQAVGDMYDQGDHDKPRLKLPGEARLAASGLTASGSPAPTGKRAQLNPAFSRWLMGLPPAWDDYAPTATRSLRPRRRP